MIARRVALSAGAALCVAAGCRPGAAEDTFGAFLAGVRAEAIGSGVSAATADRALAGLRPNPKVLELDSRPPEKTQSWARYRATRVSAARVAAGQQAMRANRAALAAISSRTGVDAAVVVAIWGLETNYGGYTGGFVTIEALATLAEDGRRDGYFRRELIEALRILDEGAVALPRMTGSYAGAMGQPQFMPSSYRRFAVSFDGAARADIWDNANDALASIANYLLRSGWQAGMGWGQPARVPPGFSVGRDGGGELRPVADWARLGVTLADGPTDGPTDGLGSAAPDGEGAVVTPDGAGGEAYMTYANFGVIRSYNHSDLYALSVGLLADEIRL